MKKTLATILCLIMLCSVFAAAISAIDGIANYSPSDYATGPATQKGWIYPLKHSLVQSGKAGSSEDDTMFLINGVKGDKIPVIDGRADESEGYMNFSMYEDYLYIYAATLPEFSYSEAEFNEWYNEVKNMNLVVKSCWDGKYLYFYFEYEIDNYNCMPSNASNMWMYNCIQFGLANPDAIDDERSETGYGIGNTNKLYTASWGQGSFVPVENSDYVGTLKTGSIGPASKKVTHEFRIDIRKALGRSEPIKSGEEVKMSWVVMANNTGNGSAGRCICFGDGICSTSGGKQAHRYIRARLIGEVETQEGAEPDYYTPTEEDWEYFYNQTASLFFHDIYETNDFISEDGITATYAEDKTFVTLTTEAEASTYFSQGRYPAGLWAKDACYAVIKHRTTTEGMNVALNFKSTGMTPEEEGGKVDFKEDAWIYPEQDRGIVSDGEWNYAIYKLDADSEVWANIITEMSIKITTGSIDIDSIRFYNWNPEERYGFSSGYWGWCECEGVCGEDCPCAGECCDECECECEIIDDSTDDDDQQGTTDKDDTPGKDDNTDVKPKKKKGCGSTVIGGASVILAATVLAGTVLLKKKED